MLLIPQHNLVLATRGSAQFFLRIYELALQASFRAEFTMEQLSRELGLVMDHMWPAYEKAALEAGFRRQALSSELVLGGWSPKAGRMVATAYAKSDSAMPAVVQPLDGGLASPGDPLRGWVGSFAVESVLAAGRLQAEWLKKEAGMEAAGGRLLAASLRPGQSFIQDLGQI